MRWAATAAAVEAAATGLILLLAPVLFGRLIFGAELSEPGQALGRLTGIVLLGFALTAWPDPSARSVTRALLAYNLIAMLYLCYLVSREYWWACCCGPLLRFIQFCLSFLVALGAPPE